MLKFLLCLTVMEQVMRILLQLLKGMDINSYALSSCNDKYFRFDLLIPAIPMLDNTESNEIGLHLGL